MARVNRYYATLLTVMRLRVFRFCKQFIDQTGRAPVVREVIDGLGVHENTARKHMSALRHADGLDVPLLASGRNAGMFDFVDAGPVPVDQFILMSDSGCWFDEHWYGEDDKEMV